MTPARTRRAFVAYEDLAADYEGTARRMARELGLAPPRAIDFGERAMVAMADRVTEQWVGRCAQPHGLR
jgi:LPS sulfotransferase NodH